jgi:hypothetical protein
MNGTVLIAAMAIKSLLNSVQYLNFNIDDATNY